MQIFNYDFLTNSFKDFKEHKTVENNKKRIIIFPELY